MLKVAILDDYQNVSQEFVDLKKLSGKYEFKIFSEPFLDEADAIEQLSDFEALLIMRERTPITKNLIDNLNSLKFVITSGLRNKSIDLEAAKKRKVIVCGTEINQNPTPELTWALILGLARNFKEEFDNMYQGYWQTTVGVELKGKILGLVGLGRCLPLLCYVIALLLVALALLLTCSFALLPSCYILLCCLLAIVLSCSLTLVFLPSDYRNFVRA